MDRKGYKDIQKSASRNTAQDPQFKEQSNAFIGNIHDGVYETDVRLRSPSHPIFNHVIPSVV